jgi:transcriptional regulator with XRE-family HTH domain
MVDTQAGSTVPRRQLGRYLEELRAKAGLTVKDVAKALERSPQTLWRVEKGAVSSRSVEIEAMCRLYGASEEMTRALCALAKETKAKGWWQAYGDVVPEWFDLYVGLEAAASKIDWYESELAPGLFQTPDYARALIRVHFRDMGESEVGRLVELRLRRQAIIKRPIDPPTLRVAVRESVLRSPVGGPSVMAGQLDRLAEVSRFPNVALRVAPFSVGLHSGMLTGAFGILRFPLNGGGEDSEPPTVYSDGYTGAIYLDKPNEVERYDQAFEDIWQAALDEEASRDLIQQAAEELR